MTATHGYSGTPLLKKLGFKDGYCCYILSPPEHYFDLLSPIPETIDFVEKLDGNAVDFIHFFTQSKDKMIHSFPDLKKHLKKEGVLWVSWPKKTSAISKDLDGNDVRKIGLDMGLVDTKVCAVDEDWSGLKFMYRLKDR